MFRHIFINQSEIYSTDLIDYIFIFCFRFNAQEKTKSVYSSQKQSAYVYTESRMFTRRGNKKRLARWMSSRVGLYTTQRQQRLGTREIYFSACATSRSSIIVIFVVYFKIFLLFIIVTDNPFKIISQRRRTR